MGTAKKEITVGVLIDSVDSYFNHRAISDILFAAEDQGIQLVFFFGGYLEKGKTSGSISYAFTLPNSAYLDALIVFPHSIAPYSPESATRLIVEQYPDIPVYSFFFPLKNVYSVWSPETDAIKTMIDHLVLDHAYTRFSLLKGPDSPESLSCLRSNLIASELAKHGITIPEELSFCGNFTYESGKKTAEALLTKPIDSPHVLVCLNDQMAIGAATEFRNKGIAVPSDIAIVGFDDVTENSLLPFTFTSINYPVWSMLSLLLERIKSDFSGETRYSPDWIEKPATFMQRESCGCRSPVEVRPGNLRELSSPGERRDSSTQLKKSALVRKNLEDIIEMSVATADTSAFIDFIHHTLTNLSRSGDLTNSFIDTFSTQWTISLLKHKDFQTQVFINTLFVDAFRLLIQTKMNTFLVTNGRNMGALAFYRGCSEILAQKKGMHETLRGIGAYLPELGVERAQLVLLCPDNPNEGEIRLSFKAGEYSDIPEGDFTRFPVMELVHSGIPGFTEPVVVLPITLNNIVYGYLVLTIQDKQFEHFSLIQELTSSLVDSAMTNTELSDHIKKLTFKNDILSQLSVIDEFTGLYNRRALYVTGKSIFEEAQATGKTTCFIFLDMNDLKKINDTWGHKEGDKAILALSRILKKCFREQDIVVRYGGDEFVVLMVNITEEALKQSLSRIDSQIEAYNRESGHEWVLSACWGYVLTNPEEGQKSFDSVIEESDAKLYEQKRIRKGTRTNEQ